MDNNQIKKCNGCGRELSLFCFRIKNKAGRLSSKCKECLAKIDKARYDRKRDEILAQKKIYTENNKYKKRKYDKIYSEKNKERKKKYREEFYATNKDEILKRNKEWRDKQISENSEKYREQKSKDSKKYYEKNKNNPYFIIKKSMTAQIHNALHENNYHLASSFLKGLGIDYIQKLKNHLESLFEPWMTWQNHGVYKVEEWDDNDPSTWTWHIDHIIPHSSFKYLNPMDKECIKAWDLSNLRPLSSKQNVKDGNRR